jgi:hypothetical protein
MIFDDNKKIKEAILKIIYLFFLFTLIIVFIIAGLKWLFFIFAIIYGAIEGFSRILR